MAICKQRKIDILNLEINKEKTGRYIIKIYLNTCDKNKIVNCPTKKIEEILYKIFNEEIVLQEEKCGMKLEQKNCYQTYISKDKYSMQIGIAKANKDGENVSGDSSIQVKLKDGKYLIALSDGMGSGSNANHYSQMAIQMLENLFVSGFDKKVSLELINSALAKNDAENTYATLDIAVLDLLQGNMEFMKLGACPTYVKTGDQVMEIQDKSAPAGMLMTLRAVTYDKDLEAGDLIVMCTDGVLDSKKEDKQWLRKIIQQIQRENPQEIADMILREAIDNDLGRARDDMTVMVIRIENN